MDATLIAALIAAASAAAASLGNRHGSQLRFIADNWGDIARALRQRGTPDAQIERFRSELFSAL
jgi:hypothetical protein